MNFFKYFSLSILSLAIFGCPKNQNISTQVKTENPSIEYSYLCKNLHKNEKIIISIFYKNDKSVIRLNNNDYTMMKLNNDIYLIDEADENGDFLVWKKNQKNLNQGQLMSWPNQEFSEPTPLYDCQVTR